MQQKDNVICRQIKDMGVNISDQLIYGFKNNEFAIQLDEATYSGHDTY